MLITAYCIDDKSENERGIKELWHQECNKDKLWDCLEYLCSHTFGNPFYEVIIKDDNRQEIKHINGFDLREKIEKRVEDRALKNFQNKLQCIKPDILNLMKYFNKEIVDVEYNRNEDKFKIKLKDKEIFLR